MRGMIIYAPLFCRNSAGVYALYRLAADLKSRGVITIITIWGSNMVVPPVFGVPVVPNVTARHFVDEYGFNVLYPEVTHGNPLNAEHVVRWVMNRPGLLGGDAVYGENETVLTYGTEYDQYVKNKISGHLTLPTIDENLFMYDPLVEKTDITVYTGKREFKRGYVERYDNLVTRTSPSHEEVAEILKRTKTLYSFDCVSNIINEARFAGCGVVLIDDGYLADGRYRSEFGDFGVSLYGTEQKVHSPREIASYMKACLGRQYNLYYKQLDRLVELIKERD